MPHYRGLAAAVPGPAMSDNQAYLARIATFADAKINPAAARWSVGGSPAPALYAQASALGLYGIEVPQSLGGLGLGFQCKAKAFAMIAAADFGFAMSLINTHNVAVRLCLSAAPPLRDNYLPQLLNGQSSACTALTEPTAGSDVAALQTRAIAGDNGWLLSGEKSWIVNARHADLAIVFAQTTDVGRSDGIGAFLVDLQTAGVERYAIDSGFAQTSIGSGGFRLHQVKVSRQHLLLEPGVAFKAILNEINGARAYVAAMCDAMLNAALTQAQHYGEQRHTFGKPLQQHSSWQHLLNQAQQALAQTAQLTARACQQLADGGDAQLLAIQAKLASYDACQQHLPQLLHAMGAEGLRPHYCFTRHLAATQMAGLTDGANHLLRARAEKLQRNS